MPTARQIREYSVQFLYAYSLSDQEEVSGFAERFWELSLETNEQALLSPKAKWVLHHAQSRPVKIEKTQNELEVLLAKLSVDPKTEELRSMIQKWVKAEEAVSEHLIGLARYKSAGTDEAKKDLAVALEQSFKALRDANIFNSSVKNQLVEFPQFEDALAGIKSRSRDLHQASSNMLMAEKPLDFPEQTDLKSIRQKVEEIEKIRQEVTEIVSKVIAQEEALDAQINALVENYQDDRVEKIDRAILRLGAYLLQNDKETPRSHILNDLIETAKKLSTMNSSKFINGILDKI